MKNSQCNKGPVHDCTIGQLALSKGSIKKLLLLDINAKLQFLHQIQTWTAYKKACKKHGFFSLKLGNSVSSGGSDLWIITLILDLYFTVQQYVKCTKELYGAMLQTVDFQQATEAARQMINSWVESQTQGKKA